MTNTTEARVLSDVVVRVGFYLLAASVLVFVAMLLLVGAFPRWGYNRDWGRPQRRLGVGVGDRADPRASGAPMRGVGSGLAVARIYIVLVAKPGGGPRSP